MHRLVLYFAALAIASSALAQDTSLLRYEGADRIQKVAAAARKEGSFMLYTSFAEKDPKGGAWLNAGILLLGPKVFEAIPKGPCSLERDHRCTAP